MRRLSRWGCVVTLASLLLTAFTPQSLRASQEDPGEIAIPFMLTASHNIVVSAVLNNKDTVNLMLHTAASDVTLTEDAVRKSKSIRFTGRDQVKSWGGKADSRFSKGNQVQLGPLQRNNISLWEDKFSGKDTDGKFGLDLFQKRIVEIDFDRRRIVLHEHLPHTLEKYEHLKIDNQNGQLLVEGSCLIEGKTYPHKFLLHSGYSGGSLLDDAFAAHAGIDGKIRITDESSLKDSFGHTIKVKKGLLPVFALGGCKISNVPVGFFAGSIGAQKMSVIGCEILMQFNIVFDIAHNDLYIALRQENSEATLHETQRKKIEIDLDRLDADGLRGLDDGKVAVSYEFCIPDTQRCRTEVKRLDATVQFMPGSSGRIGAQKGQCLCIGSTHQPHWREVLSHLAALPYVRRIIEAYFE